MEAAATVGSVFLTTSPTCLPSPFALPSVGVTVQATQSPALNGAEGDAPLPAGVSLTTHSSARETSSPSASQTFSAPQDSVSPAQA